MHSAALTLTAAFIVALSVAAAPTEVKRPSKLVYDCMYTPVKPDAEFGAYPVFRIFDQHSEADALKFAKLGKRVIKFARNHHDLSTKRAHLAFDLLFSPNELSEVKKMVHTIASRKEPVILAEVPGGYPALNRLAGYTGFGKIDSTVAINPSVHHSKREYLSTILHELTHHYDTVDYVFGDVSSVELKYDPMHRPHKNADSFGLLGDIIHRFEMAIKRSRSEDEGPTARGSWHCVDQSHNPAIDHSFRDSDKVFVENVHSNALNELKLVFFHGDMDSLNEYLSENAEWLDQWAHQNEDFHGKFNTVIELLINRRKSDTIKKVMARFGHGAIDYDAAATIAAQKLERAKKSGDAKLIADCTKLVNMLPGLREGAVKKATEPAKIDAPALSTPEKLTPKTIQDLLSDIGNHERYVEAVQALDQHGKELFDAAANDATLKRQLNDAFKDNIAQSRFDDTMILLTLPVVMEHGNGVIDYRALLNSLERDMALNASPETLAERKKIRKLLTELMSSNKAK